MLHRLKTPSIKIKNIIATILLISNFLYILADKEEVLKEHPQHHGSRSNFDQKHMGEGQHDTEMDHKAILGDSYTIILINLNLLIRIGKNGTGI